MMVVRILKEKGHQTEFAEKTDLNISYEGHGILVTFRKDLCESLSVRMVTEDCQDRPLCPRNHLQNGEPSKSLTTDTHLVESTALSIQSSLFS
jgi:hypothetical protein